jgi:hypothetical protein
MSFPTTNPPTLDQIYAAMLAALKDYAPTVNAVASISRNPEDAMLQVIDPSGPRLVLHPESGDAINKELQNTVEVHTFRLFISSNIGVTPAGRDAGMVSSDAKPPLMSHVDSVRRRVLSWRFDTTLIHQGKVFYDGYDPVFTPDGYPIAAYALTFHFRAAVKVNSDEVNVVIES